MPKSSTTESSTPESSTPTVTQVLKVEDKGVIEVLEEVEEVEDPVKIIKFTLRLGDVIVIKAPTNEILNDGTFLIEYIDKEKMMEIVDDVVNRLKEHGMKYYLELNKLNFQYPTEKYKRLAPPKRGEIEPRPGLRISRSVFPDEI